VSDLPEPMTPADCDLRGLEYMPLLGQHLFGSEFNARANDSEWRAGLTLWWAAWCQVPAASLPDDDVALCRFADLGRDVKLWKKLRNKALHGWVKCSDGRLYHPTLAKQALLAWGKRKVNKEDRSSAAERKAREREARSRMFAQLAEVGVTPDWNTTTSDLRALVTEKCGDLSRDNGEHVTPPVTVTVTAKTGRDGTYIPLPDGNGASDESSDPPTDPDKAFWDEAKAYLGKSRSGLIGKWVKEFGRDAVADAVKAAKAEGGGAGAVDPPSFIQACLRNSADRLAAREAQQAVIERRYPEQTLSVADARAMMGDAEFGRWCARHGLNQEHGTC